MIIAGFAPNSCVDYPGNIAAVIFLGGCNMNCWYCHNRDLVEGRIEEISLDYVLERLEKRKNFLDGVVITGGEALLTPLNELKDLILKIKAMGLLVKLDTNGSRPEQLKEILPLIDYVAMDIKAPLPLYRVVTPMDSVSIEDIKKSIDIIINSDIDYEFRTTFDPHLTKFDIEDIAKLIAGAKAYYVQQINIPKDSDMLTKSSDYIKESAQLADKYVPTKVRNV